MAIIEYLLIGYSMERQFISLFSFHYIKFNNAKLSGKQGFVCSAFCLIISVFCHSGVFPAVL